MSVLQGVGHEAPFLFYGLNHPLNNQVPWDVVQGLAFDNGLYKYQNNFSDYIGPAAAGTANGWVLTETAAGAGNTNLVSNVLGAFTLTTDNGANDLENLQRTTLDYAYVVGKRSGFIAKIAPGPILTTLDMLFGLAITDTSLIASEPADGYFFRKLAAENTFTFRSSKTGQTTTVVTLTTDVIVANIYRYYAFVVNTNGSIDVYWGKSLATMTRVGGIAAGALSLTTVPLALSFSIRATATAARSMLCGGVAYWREL